MEIVRGDLARPSEWLAALHGCQFCFHVAALYAGPGQIDAMYAVNVAATGALLAACAAAGVPRVVHTSTIGTVGMSERRWPAQRRHAIQPVGSSQRLCQIEVLGRTGRGIVERLRAWRW